MHTTLTRQMIEQQQRDETVRAAFVKQRPDLADQLHEGAVDLTHCTCLLCDHIRAAIAAYIESY